MAFRPCGATAITPASIPTRNCAPNVSATSAVERVRKSPPMPDNAASTSQAPPDITWLARVHVTLKPVVLDPQGSAVLGGLHTLGFDTVSSVRVGKYLEIALDAPDEA